jgi:hypothetical protein
MRVMKLFTINMENVYMRDSILLLLIIKFCIVVLERYAANTATSESCSYLDTTESRPSHIDVSPIGKHIITSKSGVNVVCIHTKN